MFFLQPSRQVFVSIRINKVMLIDVQLLCLWDDDDDDDNHNNNNNNSKTIVRQSLHNFQHSFVSPKKHVTFYTLYIIYKFHSSGAFALAKKLSLYPWTIPGRSCWCGFARSRWLELSQWKLEFLSASAYWTFGLVNDCNRVSEVNSNQMLMILLLLAQWWVLCL